MPNRHYQLQKKLEIGAKFSMPTLTIADKNVLLTCISCYLAILAWQDNVWTC